MAKSNFEKLNFTLKKINDGRGKAKKIINFTIDARDNIILSIQGEEKERIFDSSKEEISLGGKVIEPLLSYVINKWNVMLPYITYQVDKDKVLKYLEEMGCSTVSVYEKKNV